MKSVPQMCVNYWSFTESWQSPILIRVHDVKVSYNVTVLFYKCDDYTLNRLTLTYTFIKLNKVIFLKEWRTRSNDDGTMAHL